MIGLLAGKCHLPHNGTAREQPEEPANIRLWLKQMHHRITLVGRVDRRSRLPQQHLQQRLTSSWSLSLSTKRCLANETSKNRQSVGPVRFEWGTGTCKKKKKSLQLSHWRPKIRLSLLCQRGWTQNPRTFRVNCQNVLQIRFLTQICFAAGVTWRLNIFGLFIRCTSGVAWIEIYGRLVGVLLGWEQHQHAQVFHSNIIL